MANTSIIDDAVAIFSFNNELKGVTWDDTRGNRFEPLDTPQLWDGSGISSSTDLPAASHRLLTAISDVIGNTEAVLDITIMWWTTHGGLPKGLFQQAIARGLKQINDRGRKPLIRILVGIPFPVIVSVADLNKWVQDTLRLTMQPADFHGQIYIATNHTSGGPLSWNHSKIIAADGRAIVGGHNLWHADYLEFGPVNDVSGLLEGPAAYSAHQFCSKLWTKPFDVVRWGPGDKYDHISPAGVPAVSSPTIPVEPGSVRALALGRLGSGIVTQSLASNASVAARMIALCQAKSHIRISQQSLGKPGTPVRNVDAMTCIALAAALAEGVTVDVVVSNEDLEDYHGNAQNGLDYIALMYWRQRSGREKALPRTMTAQWAHLSAAGPEPLLVPQPSAEEKRKMWAELKGRLNVATIQLRDDGVPKWRDPGNTKTKVIGNHAKVYIIDDTNFYFGSDNMYKSASVAGLQEFGYLIEDFDETRKFMSHYWQPLWKRSQKKLFRAWA
jgi:phosphatidylserine/phosphatidylglycerophosphate/cardiolipin synthase-like enzyme